MDNNYEVLVNRFNGFFKYGMKRPKEVDKRQHTVARITASKLSKDLKTTPLYHLTVFDDLASATQKVHAEAITKYMVDNDISNTEVYESFVMPYDKILIYDGRSVYIVTPLNKESNVSFSVTHFVPFNDEKKHFIIVFSHCGFTNDKLVGGISATSLLEPKTLIPKTPVVDYNRAAVMEVLMVDTLEDYLKIVGRAIYNFILTSVFSKFEGTYTAVKAEELPTTGRTLSQRHNVFRMVETKLTHTKFIMNRKAQRKGYKLTHQSDMPRMLKYMRHERYSQKGTLPLEEKNFLGKKTVSNTR